MLPAFKTSAAKTDTVRADGGNDLKGDSVSKTPCVNLTFGMTTKRHFFPLQRKLKKGNAKYYASEFRTDLNFFLNK